VNRSRNFAKVSRELRGKYRARDKAFTVRSRNDECFRIDLFGCCADVRGMRREYGHLHSIFNIPTRTMNVPIIGTLKNYRAILSRCPDRTAGPKKNRTGRKIFSQTNQFSSHTSPIVNQKSRCDDVACISESHESFIRTECPFAISCSECSLI
jgi:hypothetical protein